MSWPTFFYTAAWLRVKNSPPSLPPPLFFGFLHAALSVKSVAAAFFEGLRDNRALVSALLPCVKLKQWPSAVHAAKSSRGSRKGGFLGGETLLLSSHLVTMEKSGQAETPGFSTVNSEASVLSGQKREKNMVSCSGVLYPRQTEKKRLVAAIGADVQE